MTVELFEKYQYKLKEFSELFNLVGSYPRRDKLILCHGVFDVVHPGHVRHLAYAKTKAEILIISITADRHIKKGIYRPHIPEGLRALNLAALEMVDFVIIDNNEKPLKMLKELQPDFFAKGFEYSAKGLPPATQEEAEIVESYGGKMIFTPGDVVYSSSNLINLSPPQVVLEKLLYLMNINQISFRDLRDTVKKFSKYHIHVIGDTIIDSYTRTSLIGGQTKTPTFSVLFQGQDDYIGGAGIVSQHLNAAGAKVKFSTVLGNDKLKDFVTEGLKESGIDIFPIVDKTRPTTQKNVIISESYRLIKIDKLDNQPISEDILDKLVDSVQKTKFDAVVLSDFRHGIFNRMSVPLLSKAIHKGTFKVADSQVASRWGNITEFKGFDLITPNEREARFALANQDSGVGRLATFLKNECDYKNLILKLGERGVFSVSQKKGVKTHAFSLDSFTNNVVDPVGAGDALLAYATLTLLATESLVTATIIGSMAAACECEYDGNIPIKPESLLAKIDKVEELSGYKMSEKK